MGHDGSCLLLWRTPPPPMGEVHLLRVVVLSAVPFLPPHSHFVLQWGASDDLGFSIPSPSSRPCTRSVCFCLGGAAPPLGQEVPPPSLSCRPCARSTRFCSEGTPPSSVSWFHAVGARSLVRVSPSTPLPCVGSVRC